MSDENWKELQVQRGRRGGALRLHVTNYLVTSPLHRVLVQSYKLVRNLSGCKQNYIFNMMNYGGRREIALIAGEKWRTTSECEENTSRFAKFRRKKLMKASKNLRAKRNFIELLIFLQIMSITIPKLDNVESPHVLKNSLDLSPS